MSDDAMITDLADALRRLRRAFEKHGLSGDFAIALQDRNDADRMRALRTSNASRSFIPLSGFARADTCCEIVGVEIRRPS